MRLPLSRSLPRSPTRTESPSHGSRSPARARLKSPCTVSRRGVRRLDTSRGFTLMEMMVVVLIITLFASIALPGMARTMKINRAREATESIATIFRGARLRAMGRGGAVLVSFTGNTFTTFEAIRGTTAATASAGVDCRSLPESSCINPSNRWGPASDRREFLTSTNYGPPGDFTVAAETMNLSNAAVNRTFLDICFTPSGRAYSRTIQANPLTAMTSPATFTITRIDEVGRDRKVIVTSSGNARSVAE